MKAISLWQPWASAIALGLKRIETRGWPTRHRGIIAIHAAKRWTDDERDWAQHFARLHDIPALAMPPLGAIVATGHLVDVKPTEELVDMVSDIECSLGNYGAGRFGWLLEDIVALRPIAYRGMQGLFEIPDNIPGLSGQPTQASEGHMA